MALDAGLIKIRSLAQAAKDNQHDGMALNRYGEVMPPAVALDMIALIEALQAEVEALRSNAGQEGEAVSADDGKREFEVWVQGFNHKHAGVQAERCLGKYQATTFDEAMAMHVAPLHGYWKCEDTGRWYWRTLGIFDNQQSAIEKAQEDRRLNPQHE